MLVIFLVQIVGVHQPHNMPEEHPSSSANLLWLWIVHCSKILNSLFLCSKQLAHLQMEGSSWNHQKQHWIKENQKMQSVMGQRYLITKNLVIYSVSVSHSRRLLQQICSFDLSTVSHVVWFISLMFPGSCKARSSLWSLPSNDSWSLQPSCCSSVPHGRLQSGLSSILVFGFSGDVQDRKKYLMQNRQQTLGTLCLRVKQILWYPCT